MAKKLTPEEIIEQVQKMETKDQLQVQEGVDKIISDKKKATEDELELLKTGKQN